MDNKDKPLWSDGKTWEDLENIADSLDRDVAMFSLYEDMLCLKQDNKQLRDALSYAIDQADGWYDESRGGKLDLLDKYRHLVAKESE